MKSRRKPFVSIPVLAKRLGISINTARSMTDRGQIETVLIGSRYMIPAAALEAFLRRGRRAA